MSLSSSTLLRERRALALILLGFCTSIFSILALAQGGAWVPCFSAMAVTYGLAFFAVAAEWFWGRWFAMGLASSGVAMALLGLVSTGWEIGIAIWGGIHLLIYVPMMGIGMAERYEDRPDWRKRFSLSDDGAARIQRAVKGAAASLPTLIFYALSPRQDQMLMGILVLAAGIGTFGLLRFRFWGVLVLGSLAATLGVLSFTGDAFALTAMQSTFRWSLGAAAAIMLTWAVSPFVIPTYRYWRRLS
jgi:hypothetical protein